MVGKTKDVGYQFGIRRTAKIPAEDAWDYLLSKEGLDLWLGKLTTGFQVNQEFNTENGISGLVRVFEPNSHIRINWKRDDLGIDSTVQLRVIANQEKTIIAIHQEKLTDSAQRAHMKEYWTKKMDNIIAALNSYLS